MEQKLWMPLRDRDVRLLIGGMGLSQIGDWLYNVALIVFVLERTGSGAWIAVAGIVRLLPYVVFGTIGGMIADRWPRRRTMVQSDLIRAAVMFTLTVVAARDGPPLAAIVLAGIATTFSVAYGPCVNAAIPRIVGVVNTLSATVTNLSYALGGILLILGSPTAAFAVNGATFLISAGLTRAIQRIWVRTRLVWPTCRSRPLSQVPLPTSSRGSVRSRPARSQASSRETTRCSARREGVEPPTF